MRVFKLWGMPEIIKRYAGYIIIDHGERMHVLARADLFGGDFDGGHIGRKGGQLEQRQIAPPVESDDFGLDPAVMYGAMFSAAFFERDIVRLIEAGLAALPAQSRFAAIVRHMQQLHKQYPKYWQKARPVIA